MVVPEFTWPLFGVWLVLYTTPGFWTGAVVAMVPHDELAYWGFDVHSERYWAFFAILWPFVWIAHTVVLLFFLLYGLWLLCDRWQTRWLRWRERRRHRMPPDSSDYAI